MAPIIHVCVIEKVERKRQTGWLVRCVHCGPADTVSRTLKQAQRLKYEHEESRRVGVYTENS